MTSRPILMPGPDHPIGIERNPKRITVLAHPADAQRVETIADTRNALTLREAGYAPVQYIPRGDINMTRLRRSAHTSYCPYKGEAAYFDLVALGRDGEKAAWTYEQPYAAVAEIAGHLAFYPTIVSISEGEE